MVAQPAGIGMTGEQLKERRKALGLGLNELARALDLSPSTLSRYEAGKLLIRAPRLLDHALRDLARQKGSDCGLP